MKSLFSSLFLLLTITLVSNIFFVEQVHADIDSGLIGYWNFDDGSGTTATDSTINSNNGTLDEPTWSSGKVGSSALTFDGVDDLVVIGNQQPFNFTNLGTTTGMTIAMWVNPLENSVSLQYLMSKINVSTAGWYFAQSPGSHDAYSFLVDYSGSDLSIRTSTGSTIYGQWQHVVMTWDGSMNASGAAIYIDGVEATYGIQNNATGTPSIGTSYNLNIGDNTGRSRSFMGSLDDVRVYNRALNSSDVSELYEYASAADTTSPTITSIASSTTATSATITWSTNESATSTVEYGLTAGYGATTTSSVFKTAHSFTLTGLTPNTLYYYKLTSADSSMNTATSTDLTFTTGTVDTTVPTITSIASSTTGTTATITWTTDESATTQVAYGSTTSYGSQTTLDTNLVTSHSAVVTGLISSTLYHFRVSSSDASGNISTSTDYTFRTDPSGPVFPTAIAMDYSVVKNRSKYMTLAAWSSDVTYNTHSYADYPNINWSKRYKEYRMGDGGAAITLWRIISAPEHGTLYEGTTAVSDNDTISNPDDLIYVPSSDYVGEDFFTFQVTDSVGVSNIATVSITVEDSGAYTMPVGIPSPGFGISDEPPADPVEWPNAQATGFYYIDNSVTCSDTNTYGYPANPRCTIPTNPVVGAGQKMVLKASPNPYYSRNFSWQQIQLNGSVNNRAWIVGVNDGPNKPIVMSNPSTNTGWRMEGSYWTIDGIIFDGVGPAVRGDLGAESYVVIRHSEIRNRTGTTGSATSMNASTQNGLYFDVFIHANGLIEEDLSMEHDVHGIQVNSAANLWILDSMFSENAGDSIQVNGAGASNIYVGRNKMHSEGENAVDTKEFNTMVISENDGWDMRRVGYGNSGGNAQIFYINDEGTQLGGWWAINNRAWDTGGPGIASASLGADVYIIGNTVAWCNDGIQNWTHGGRTAFIYNNTIDKCRNSAFNVSVPGGPGAFTRIAGNYVGSGDWIYQLLTYGGSTTDTGSFLEFDYNYFEETINLLWANTPRDLSWMRANTSWLDNSIENITPQFVGQDNFDYHLTQSSPLVDEHSNIFSGYTNFNSQFSTSIQKDRSDVVRPENGLWDIGAYEYSSNITDITAPLITNVSSNKSNATYGVGDVIDIKVFFSEAVTSTGLITLTLETGNTDRSCTFSVSGGSVGTCDYVVQAGDESSDLQVKTITGTIKDQSNNSLVNFTPTSNLAANKNIVIDTSVVVDTTDPVLVQVTPISTPTSDTTPSYTFSGFEFHPKY